MVLHRQTMIYLRPPADLVPRWDHAPAVGGVGRDGRAWLAPPGQGSLLKISSDSVCRDVPSFDYAPPDDARIWTSRLLREPILTDAYRYTFVGAKQCHYVTDAVSGGASLIRLGPNVWSRTAAGMATASAPRRSPPSGSPRPWPPESASWADRENPTEHREPTEPRRREEPWAAPTTCCW